jgi:uncharacterized protein (TIGR00251 family)
MLDLNEVRAKLAAAGEVTIPVKVIPRAAKSECAGFLDDGSLKIRLAAVPDKGKANEELRRFLAEIFGLTRRDVSIVTGETSPRKLVRLKRAAGDE